MNMFEKDPKASAIFQISLGFFILAINYKIGFEDWFDYINIAIGLACITWGGYNCFIRSKDKAIVQTKKFGYFFLFIGFAFLFLTFTTIAYPNNIISSILGSIASAISIVTGALLLKKL